MNASPAAQADAHAALLDWLGIDSATVAGASAGAPSAVELALRHPERVRALVLLVPMGYTPDRAPGVHSTPTNDIILRVVLSGAAAPKPRVDTLLIGCSSSCARAQPNERDRVTTIMESVLPLSRRVTGIRNDSAVRLQPLPLERINVPTLIITTRDDLFDTVPAAEYMARRIPGAKLIVLDSGGHLFVGRQREVSRRIADFLTEVDAHASPRPSGEQVRSS